MSNPFAALGDADDVEFTEVRAANKQGSNADKIKKAVAPVSHGQAKSMNNHINIRHKEDATQIRREGGNRPNKDISDHRAHDRRSGTGRVSEPRKLSAGGAGGARDIKDDFNQDKILAKVREEGAEEEAPAEPVVPSLSLEEYYQKQGVDLSELNVGGNKGPAKKGEIKADWVTKEKLTVLKTREDVEIEDNQRKATVLRNINHKVEASPETELLGFKSALPESRKPRDTQQAPQAPQERKGKDQPKKGAKIVVNEEDFPSL